jgi:hypothetical protein
VHRLRTSRHIHSHAIIEPDDVLEIIDYGSATKAVRLDPGRKQKQGRRTSTTKTGCKHETTEVNQNETEQSTQTSGKEIALVTAQELASCSVHPLPGLPWKG